MKTTNSFTSNFDMKQLLSKLTFLAIPILILIILINYFGDAANLFNRDFEKKIAEILIQGKNVTNISNYDERLLQEEIILSSKIKPDVVIIGSSRAMLIGKDYFPGLKTMNNSVSAASLEDLIAIYELYKTSQKIPKKIVIGIDPWTFQLDDNRTRWKSIGKYYYRFKNNDEMESESQLALDQLISLSYFQNSLPILYNKIVGKYNPVPTHTSKNSTLTKLADGSITYGLEKRHITSEKVIESAKVWISNGMIKRYKDFKTLQPKWNEFLALIADMKKNNIEIVFVLSPFHPMVYKEMTYKFPIINEEEEEILKFAKQSNIPLYGSFNPAKYNLSVKEFYDETHPKEDAMKEIFREKLN